MHFGMMRVEIFPRRRDQIPKKMIPNSKYFGIGIRNWDGYIPNSIFNYLYIFHCD